MPIPTTLGAILLIGSLAAAPTTEAAVRGAPSAFADFPAGPAFHGERARLRLRDARSRRYASALAQAAAGPIDFDGRYVLAQIGCGAGCIEVAAIDAATGSVAWLPASVSGWPPPDLEPTEHRRDSRLLVVHGQLAEVGPAGPHSFVFDGRRFSRLGPARTGAPLRARHRARTPGPAT